MKFCYCYKEQEEIHKEVSRVSVSCEQTVKMIYQPDLTICHILWFHAVSCSPEFWNSSRSTSLLLPHACKKNRSRARHDFHARRALFFYCDYMFFQISEDTSAKEAARRCGTFDSKSVTVTTYGIVFTIASSSAAALSNTAPENTIAKSTNDITKTEVNSYFYGIMHNKYEKIRGRT